MMTRRLVLAAAGLSAGGLLALALGAALGRTAMQTPDYLEFTTENVAASKAFYAAVFGMAFTDYGPDYAGAHGGDVEIGIARGEAGTPPLPGFQTDDIAAAEATVREAGGAIIRETYAFPGGRRFHFRDPGGTELLVYQADEGR